MACGVTLKRSIDLDSFSPDHSIKRRRTSNVCHHSPYHPVASGFAQQQPNAAEKPPSVFDIGPKISSEELQAYLRNEIRTLRRRNSNNRFVRNADSPPSATSSDSDNDQRMESSGGVGHRCAPVSVNGSGQSPDRSGGGPIGTTMMMLGESSNHVTAAADINRKMEKQPLFTLKQVQIICERLLKEQEARLSGEYEKILNAKLAEQYESFVRFTYDQIHRRLEDTPMSYLS